MEINAFNTKIHPTHTHTQVKEDVPVGYVVGAISAKDNSDADNLISDGQHITYTLTSLNSDTIEDAFDMDRNTGSLVVARLLDREQQSEYRLEIRALDTTASNNPQSSAITVRVEIVDVNDNAPAWIEDPIVINVVENTAIGSAVYNFTAFDADAGQNGAIQYTLLRQQPATDVFAVDPLTGTLSLLAATDYEQLTEYLLVVQATDQSVSVADRLSTSVTARVLIADANDNSPVFVSPSLSADMQASVIHLSDATAVGARVTHVLAVDSDSGDNGRVTYAILSGNEDEYFNCDPNTGFVQLVRPLTIGGGGENNRVRFMLTNGKFTLMLSASDNGVPVPRETRMSLQIIVQGSNSNPPRFLETVYHANVSENIAAGNFVVRVSAKNFQGDHGKCFEICIF